MTAMRGRRLRRRAGIVSVAVAMLFAAGAVLVWWLVVGSGARPVWPGTERAAAIASIVGAVFGGISAAATVVALRQVRPQAGRRPAAPGPVLVGRVPRAAAWFQARRLGVDLARAARSGRTAVLTQVLAGMGGIGKTQLAAQFARQLLDGRQVDLLVWVTAASRDAIISRYAQAAVALGVVGGDDQAEHGASALMAWLERADRRWLIVLDNLDVPEVAAGWWPPVNRNGRTVVTTRRRDAALATDDRIVIDVDLFTPAEAVDYLARAVGDPRRLAEVDRLAAELGFLPLALAQAAAYVRDRGLNCAEYRRRLADQRRQLSDLVPEPHALPDEHRDTVAATWTLSVEAAGRLHPAGLARPVLELAALLDPNGIPVALFTTEVVRTYLASRRDEVAPVPADDVRDALHNLHRLSLATVSADQVRVHALVQRASRDQMDPRQVVGMARVAADALLLMWPDHDRDPAYSQTLRANTAALREVTGAALLTPACHRLLFRAGLSLRETGHLTAAVSYGAELHAACEQALGVDHADTLTARHYLAILRGAAGEPASAVTTLQAVLADRLRVLGPDHPDTLASREALARWRGPAGDPAGAVAGLDPVLADRIRVLGADHPDTLDTRHILGYWRGRAGDLAGAIEELTAVLDDRTRVHGADHPRTLITRRELAGCRGYAGDPAAAVGALRVLVADALRVLGPSHPYTLMFRADLIEWQDWSGRPAAAVQAWQALLDDYLRVLGPEHPHTLETRYELAVRRWLAGDTRGAVAALEQVLADQLRVHGPDHPATLLTRHRRGNWYGEAGDPAAAVEALERLLADQVRVLAADHPDLTATRDSLNHWRRRQGL